MTFMCWLIPFCLLGIRSLRPLRNRRLLHPLLLSLQMILLQRRPLTLNPELRKNLGYLIIAIALGIVSSQHLFNRFS